MYLADKLFTWAAQVEEMGIEEVRKLRGYHDEPLKGDKQGYRSIRLNRSYRAIYSVRSEIILIEEVNKHEY
ncbi:MAG: type II toxin-antitoxin system mRNA interferase toxin, RelE/StbE family [Pseudomonadota bacterium]